MWAVCLNFHQPLKCYPLPDGPLSAHCFYVPARLTAYSPGSDILYVWSQYDGVNIEQWNRLWLSSRGG